MNVKQCSVWVKSPTQSIIVSKSQHYFFLENNTKTKDERFFLLSLTLFLFFVILFDIPMDFHNEILHDNRFIISKNNIYNTYFFIKKDILDLSVTLFSQVTRIPLLL